MNALIRNQNQQIAGWPTFGNLFAIPSALDGLFESPFAELGEVSKYFGAWSPAVDVHEDADVLEVKVELPGLKREDIEVALEDGQLSISGERTIEESKTESRVHRTERFTGKFQRVINLPSEVKAAEVAAHYKDGVLTITLPKAEEAKRKQITVKVD